MMIQFKFIHNTFDLNNIIVKIKDTKFIEL